MLTLWERLESRGTDDLQTRQLRFQTASQELAQANRFENFVINSNLEHAYEELRQFIESGKELSLTTKEGLDFCQKLRREVEEDRVPEEEIRPDWIERHLKFWATPATKEE